MSLIRRFFSNRIFVIFALMAALFGVLFVRLGSLQLRRGDTLSSDAQSLTSKTLTLTGGRGTIYDANMQPLAYDESCYNVTFYRDPSRRKTEDLYEYSRAILGAIEIIEKNGGEMTLAFNLYLNERGQPYLDFNTTNETTFARREEMWRSNLYVKSTPLEELWDTLVKRYGIEDLTYERQRQILSVWQEMQMNAFLSTPIVIATNVNEYCVAQIEVLGEALPGFAIERSSVRVYPREDMASHIVGYVGRIMDDEQLKQYVAKGYSSSALVGLTGIERTMESQLTGNVAFRKGSQQVEVDRRGKVVRVLEEQAPVDGNNVVLTMDSGFQRVLEKALQDNIDEVNRVEWEKLRTLSWIEQNADELTGNATIGKVTATMVGEDVYQLRDRQTGELRYAFRYEKTDTGANVISLEEDKVLRRIQLAHSGAAVVMNVHDGSVQAMASLPGYDLNLFTANVDTQKQQALFQDTTFPMLNRAIASRFTPGSIFKMATGLAGLMEGVITPEETIDCEGEYTKHVISGRAPRCWTSNPADHAAQDIVKAIYNSCNYYFFTVADRLGIQPLTSWVSALGLTQKTGIELPGETTGIMGNPLSLYDSTRTLSQQDTAKPRLAGQRIQNLLIQAGTARGLTYEQERLDRVTKLLLDLADPAVALDSLGVPIRQILLDEMSMPTQFISSMNLINNIIDALREIRWDPNETLKASIGQSIDQLTVVGVARYISALVNGGTVYEARLVDKVVAPDGTVVVQKEPVVVNKIENAEWALEYIRTGMHGVISPEDGGTAAKYFSGYAYTDQIGAKTGTAETNELDVENNAWFVSFTPFDDPDLALVVCIPNGFSGGLASLTVKDVVAYYMERGASGGELLTSPGTMIE